MTIQSIAMDKITLEVCIVRQNAIGHISEWPCLVGKKMHYDRKCHDHIIPKNKPDKKITKQI